MNAVQKAINQLINGKNLSRSDSRKAMRAIMNGEGTDAQISAFLVALRMKGETVDEIAGAVEAIKSKSTRIKSKFKNVVDTCGTGGDALNTFNISTAAALVAAGAGVAVAKHGNRSVSSKSGSADVLKSLGVNIDLSPVKMEECLYVTGITFLFAPKLQTSVRYAMGPRSEIGARTIFNILGPLLNPARTKRQLIGVYDKNLVRQVVEVLEILGAEQILAVNGHEGMDEISITGPTKISELINGKIYDYTISPENFELDTAPLAAIQVKTVAESKRMLKNVLKGKPSPALDVVLLNAGATIKVSGKADSMWDGVKMAREAIQSGRAHEVLEKLIKYTNSN
jgi:anthranilate phosphoribosyltransferase